ncbi:phage Gp37/Gp68 family protein [Nostoc punctiforme]|uniref:Phage Gp37Gp68 family protein n=1 Tax=Nostoc punctiforme (strain ATCC 29133 / PCC 73102) TaxID=63737 RepID=B2ITF4_NOSP7|nr:phage Gp37/Gp68 family protein [Nostoc punctiforme]ACC81185.1 phage Gp37Gp68 family protein [Nostoc punctiforme PCC 73102]
MSTNISWTDETINPIVGCSRISAGCQNCYASTAAASARLQQFPQYQKVKDWNGTVEFAESALLKPLSWKKPKRIFVCSMSDLFHENVPDQWRDRVFGIMAAAHWHIFQVLTKRPLNALKYFQNFNLAQRIKDAGNLVCKPELPLKNVWFGVTCENQEMADKRIPILLQIPAKVRFLSCEPLLEEIDLSEVFGLYEYEEGKFALKVGSRWESSPDWVIVGGESGKDARVCHIDWVRSLTRQCQAAEVPVFVKQLGSNCIESLPYIAGVPSTDYQFKTSDRKGGDISEFPEDLQVRKFPDIHKTR